MESYSFETYLPWKTHSFIHSFIHLLIHLTNTEHQPVLMLRTWPRERAKPSQEHLWGSRGRGWWGWIVLGQEEGLLREKTDWKKQAINVYWLVELEVVCMGCPASKHILVPRCGWQSSMKECWEQGMREGDEGRKDPTRSWGGVSGVSGCGGASGPGSSPVPPVGAVWCWCCKDTQRPQKREEELRVSFLWLPLCLRDGTWNMGKLLSEVDAAETGFLGTDVLSRPVCRGRGVSWSSEEFSSPLPTPKPHPAEVGPGGEPSRGWQPRRAEGQVGGTERRRGWRAVSEAWGSGFLRGPGCLRSCFFMWFTQPAHRPILNILRAHRRRVAGLPIFLCGCLQVCLRCSSRLA